MDTAWEIVESGPASAEQTVLLLPGGMCSARSYGSILGTLPMTVLKRGVASMVKHARVPPERRAELQADFARNNTRDMRRGLQAYLRWLHRDDDPARRLCDTDVPVWVVRAEKGDGGLTQHERATLEGCPHVRVVTVPGHVFFLQTRCLCASRT